MIFGASLLAHTVQDSTDSLLVPVLQEYDKRQSQLRLDAFYTMTHRFAKIKSKRLQAAVSTAMGREVPEEMVLGESLVAGAAAPPGRQRQARASADLNAATASRSSPAQVEQAAADADVANHKKRRRRAGQRPAPTWSESDESACEGELVNNVMQGFFY